MTKLTDRDKRNIERARDYVKRFKNVGRYTLLDWRDMWICNNIKPGDSWDSMIFAFTLALDEEGFF